MTDTKLPYLWGNPKGKKYDALWNRQDLIYRWVRQSDRAIAYIGIPETRILRERIQSYMNAASFKLTEPNRKVYEEHQRLSQIKDFLFLEVTDVVPSYDLTVLRERRQAEALLIGYYRPYLQ